MGLFDFLKGKPEPGPPTPAPTPPPAAGAPAGDAPAKAGPRYQGSSYTTPAPPPVPVPPLPPQLQVPEVPPALPFEPTNVLEQLLLLAATEEQARAPFYQALLQENVIMVLAPEQGLTPGEVQLSEGQQIQLQALQDGRLPIFSSPERLNDGGLDHGDMSWVWIPGHAFFQMTQGQEVVLNPFSPAGKLLAQDELQALLSGQLTQAGPGLPPDAQVTLAAPDVPAGLAEALSTFGAAHPAIEAIYLAQMQLVGTPQEQPARLLMGFVTTDQSPDFMQDLGPALEGHTGQFQHIDLMLLDPNSDEGVNPYFRQPDVQPVYQK